MGKKLLIILVVLLSSIIISSCNINLNKVHLRLRLKEGKTYYIKTVVNQKISQKTGRQQENITQKIGTGYAFKVKDIEDNGVTSVKVTFNSISLKEERSTGTIEYDSSNPPAVIPPVAATYASLIGQSFSMQISPEGKINSIQGMEPIIKIIMKKLDLPKSQEQYLRDKFGDKVLKENMENILAIYPNKPVGIGHSWTKKAIISKRLPMVLDNNYRLKERKNGITVLEVRSRIKPSSVPIKMGSVKLSYDISGTQKGSVKLQESTGWIIHGKLSQQLSGQAKVEDPKLSRPLFFPISVEGTIDIKSFKK